MSDEPDVIGLPAIHGPSARVLVTCAGIVDARGNRHTPGSLLLEFRPAEGAQPWLPDGCRYGAAIVLASGSPATVAGHDGARNAVRVAMPGSILIPGLVNTHAHLDLTHVGPRPYDPRAGFSAWLDMVRRERAAEPEAIAASARRGIRLMLSGGVVAVGDISGAPRGLPSLSPYLELSKSALLGVSFLEFFAIGRGEERGLQAAASALAESQRTRSGRVRIGIQPHAPVSVSRSAYLWACERAAEGGMPIATHLAETAEEHEFISVGRGPQREFLEALGLWDERCGAGIGLGRSPVGHLQDCFERSRFVLAHVNDASDEDIEILAVTGQSVAYCPRASEYFGNHARLGPHRYQDMIERGINVALGTDSIINLPSGPNGSEPREISILDEMKRLHTRDGADPAVLLRMGTLNGARALGLNESGFAFDDGASLAGLVAVGAMSERVSDPALAILGSRSFARTLLVGNPL